MTDLHDIRAVSVGGGTGQPQLIRALRVLGCHIDSVVAMADDGGSTGLLRECAHVVPPGDIRKCISALASDPESALARAFAHRFPYIQDHALGNLLLVALAEETGSFVEAIADCERVLDCVGHVHPSTLDSITLAGKTVDGDIVEGQARISYGLRPFERVWLDSDRVAVNDAAARAILDADLVVLGPGSLFTSIVPNVLVPGIRDAIVQTHALRVFVCPKIDSLGETSGMSVADHVEALLGYGLKGAIDLVLVHRGPEGEAVYPYPKRAWQRMAQSDAVSAVVSSRQIEEAKEAPFGPIRATDEDIALIEALGPRVVVRDFTADGASAAVHDVHRLAAALAEAMP